MKLGDLDGIVGAYATPCFVVKGGQVLRHQDQAAKRRYFGDLLAGNQRQGPHAWRISELDPRVLRRDAAMVTVRWVCRRPDGSTIWELLDSYLPAAEQGQCASWATWCTPDFAGTPGGRRRRRPSR